MNVTHFLTATALLTFAGCSTPEKAAWQVLFPHEGIPPGWRVTSWSDLSQPAPAGTVWLVRDGILTTQGPRNSWLVSEPEYGDFELEFEFLLGERGNSGCALRTPLFGDPAFDGLELQMADFRYNPEAAPSELTGGLYRAVAPVKQVYRPTEWNRYHVRCQGSRIQVTLNGEAILDVNLDQETSNVTRHNGAAASPLRDRPRRGHLGFQELSQDSHVQIRNARLRVLD